MISGAGLCWQHVGGVGSTTTTTSSDRCRGRLGIWNRKRNIIPPYNKSVSTNIGRVFLNLLDKHFHIEHKLNKIFNRNSVKVSIGCTRNIEHIIKKHNRKITESYIEKSAETSCNCKEKNKFPLEGNCLIKNIVYMATVETETISSSYICMTGNSFKTRYYNHIKSFKNKRHKNENELSKYIWKLKEREVEHTITWKKLRQSNTCQRRSGLCNLCIEEKVEILLSKAKPSTQLNRRFEVSTCRLVSPPTSIAPTSKLIKTEPNRPLHLSEDHRRHRRMRNTVSKRAEVIVTLTVIALRIRY